MHSRAPAESVTDQAPPGTARHTVPAQDLRYWAGVSSPHLPQERRDIVRPSTCVLGRCAAKVSGSAAILCLMPVYKGTKWSLS